MKTNAEIKVPKTPSGHYPEIRYQDSKQSACIHVGHPHAYASNSSARRAARTMMKKLGLVEQYATA